MPLWTFPLLLALCAITSLVAGIWLLLHLQALAVLFRGQANIVPGPTMPRASRRSLLIALILFNLGWMASIGIWTFVMTGEANEVVVQEE